MLRHAGGDMCVVMLEGKERQRLFRGILCREIVWMQIAGDAFGGALIQPAVASNDVPEGLVRPGRIEIADVLADKRLRAGRDCDRGLEMPTNCQDRRN